MVERIAALRGRGPGGRALPHERAEPALRRGAPAPAASPTWWWAASGFYERREVKDLLAYLRARPEPRRPGRAAPRAQRAPARHRRADDGRRSSGVAAERGVSPLGGPGRARGRGAASRARHPAARALPRAARPAPRGGASRWDCKGLLERILEATGYSAALAAGGHARRARTGWRTWPSSSPPPPTTRRARTTPTPRRLPRPGRPALRRRPGRGRRARRPHDAARGQGPRVRAGVPGGAGGGPRAPLAQPDERRRRWRRSAGSATWA